MKKLIKSDMIECQLFRKEGTGGGPVRVYIIENEEYERNVTGFKKQILKNTRNLRADPPFSYPNARISSGFEKRAAEPFYSWFSKLAQAGGERPIRLWMKNLGPPIGESLKFSKSPILKRRPPYFSHSLSLSLLFF